MEDLAGKITELLGNPEIMNQIKQLSGFSGSCESENSKHSDHPPDTESECESESDDSCEFPAEMLQMFLKIGPLLSSFNKEDKYTRFLKALKPLLSKERQKKIDSSSKILQIIKILPLLKNKDFLWNKSKIQDLYKQRRRIFRECPKKAS